MDIFEENNKKLGFGMMRLPLLDENDYGSIDIDTLKKMVDEFISNGLTYFDTAIMYCGHKSQNAVKKVLTERYPRTAFTMATKLHIDYVHSFEDRDIIFNNQLEATGLTYFDYYLIHDLGSDTYPKYTKYDCFNWLIEKQKQGLVKHIGISHHDSSELLDTILTEHPEIEFVQLQLNYLDWESEGVQSHKCYDVCLKHNKPVVVMEPVRGGTLADVPKEVEQLFKGYAPNMSVASWAIRFAASHENVKVVLSGMSNVEQITDNISYMRDFKPLDTSENKIIKEALEIIQNSVAIPCTGCSYCVGGCPINIPIPRYFALYNADIQEKDRTDWRPQQCYYDRLTNTFGKASECIGCGQCEGICPQHLEVTNYLKTISKHFEKTK